MEDATLYSLLSDRLLRKWRETIEQTEGDTWFFTKERDTLKALEAELNEKSRKLLTAYALALEDRIDYVQYNLKIKILNFGIKLGLDLQSAFTAFEDS